MADIETLSNEIDALLERYLDLLNTYTTLRAHLNTTQVSFHQNLSRANFTSPTNTRYDSSSYPSSISATRLCSISSNPASPSPSNPTHPNSISTSTNSQISITQSEAPQKDPLLFFGLLTPPSLKAAQTDAVKTVQELVPRLCEVDAEMKELEIRIRRARKFRGKAEVLVGKEAAAIEKKGNEGIVV